MGAKAQDDAANDLDSLIVPIYALTAVGGSHGAAGWMGFRAVAPAGGDGDDDDDDDDRGLSSRAASLFEIDISPKTLDAALHIVIIFLVLFIIINCMCKFVWLFLK